MLRWWDLLWCDLFHGRWQELVSYSRQGRWRCTKPGCRAARAGGSNAGESPAEVAPRGRPASGGPVPQSVQQYRVAEPGDEEAGRGNGLSGEATRDSGRQAQAARGGPKNTFAKGKKDLAR